MALHSPTLFHITPLSSLSAHLLLVLVIVFYFLFSASGRTTPKHFNDGDGRSLNHPSRPLSHVKQHGQAPAEADDHQLLPRYALAEARLSLPRLSAARTGQEDGGAAVQGGAEPVCGDQSEHRAVALPGEVCVLQLPERECG